MELSLFGKVLAILAMVATFVGLIVYRTLDERRNARAGKRAGRAQPPAGSRPQAPLPR